jgi:hypothetical protein
MVKSIKILEIEGKKFSYNCNDFNAIHLNQKIGYNPIYGEKSCHGYFVFIKFLKAILKKNKKLF